MWQEHTLLDTRQNYDNLSRWYDLFSSSEQRMAGIGLKLLNVQPGEKVLEIGFGTGHALINLARAIGGTGSVCGIDLSPGMITVARRRIQQSGLGERISIHIGSASVLPYPDHQFQAGFMSFTLELFGPFEIPVVLAECRRVLQTGGRLGIVSLAKKDSLAVHNYEWFHVHFPKVVDCHPIFLFPLLEKVGFEVTHAMEKRLWGLPVDAIVAQRS
jgi:ubiquinone/menaquinone biosynthesis C-methylase UbiE